MSLHSGCHHIGVDSSAYCPEYAGHPLRELSLWVLPPVIAAILLTGVFAYPILGAGFSVVGAVIYLIFARYFKN